jgi:membrane fusion protein (multidrug efflux system)
MAILLVLTGMLAGCGQRAPEPAAAPPVEVEVVVLKPEDAAARGYATQSTLMVEREADLLAEEEGRLLEVLVDQGRRVRKGELLVRMDDSRLRKTFEQDRADTRRLEVQSKQAQVIREAAEVELQRQTELRKEGLGSLRDYDRARFNLEAVKQDVEKARFDLERARAKLEEDEIRMGKLQVRAPFDGLVSRRYAREGQYLQLGEKILRVTELRPLLVRFTVPETIRRAAIEGRTVEVKPADPSLGAVNARVIRTAFVVDAASGTVECVALLQEPVPDALVPGIGVEVRIADAQAGEPGAAFVVPFGAVRRTAANEGSVFIVRGDKLEKRNVKLGAEAAGGVRVVGGVAAGDRVVVSAAGNLQEGAAVRVRP